MATTKKTENSGAKVCFAALDPYLQINIPVPVQKELAGKKYVSYGADNLYPKYLLELYNGCSTLKAIIDGNVDYVLGDDIAFANVEIDRDSLVDTLRETVRDWYIFGYAFLQVIRDITGKVTDLVRLPAEWVRTDKDREAFWYCDKWDRRGFSDALVYPAFMPKTEQLTGVLMLGGGRGVYPSPLWSAAIKDAEMERRIDEFHLNELSNNFLSSVVMNFNNGQPSDKQKEEIERNLNEKFSGSENAGRFFLSFNENVANRTTVDRLSSDDFDKRYDALAKRTREQIFISFKAQPILFGLTSETNTGFSTQEFGDLFRLYNKTMISPRQDMLRRAMAQVFGSDSMTITPFTL